VVLLYTHRADTTFTQFVPYPLIKFKKMIRTQKLWYGILSFVGASAVFVFVAIFAASVTVSPQSAYAVTATSSVVVTLNVDTGISISAPGNSNMSTHISVAQNSAVGTTTWTVTTNDVNGYTLGLNATSTPAMQQNSTTTIADYQTGAPNTWSVTNGAAFGYSAFGSDVATSTWGNATSSCSGGTNGNATSTVLKYKGFTTSPSTVASRSATTTFAGSSTTVCYAAEQNNFFIPSGTYQATIVATATAL